MRRSMLLWPLAGLTSLIFLIHVYSMVTLFRRGDSTQTWTLAMMDEFVRGGGGAGGSSGSSGQHRSAAAATATGFADEDDGFVEPTEPLNIVILYPDDWRYDTVENPIVHTPFLDRVASSLGLQFARNFVTTSICWISRATLFTGEYAARHQSLRLRKPVPFYDRWNDTWVGRLRQAGYHTGLCGKWQFEDDQVFVKSAFDWSRLSGGHWGRWESMGKLHMTKVHTLEALEFLRTRPPEKKFALTVAYYPPKAVGTSREPGAQWSPDPATRKLYDNVTIPPPHDPDGFWNLAPEVARNRSMARGRWRERFEGEERYQASLKNYYSLVTQIDESMRAIVEELERQAVLNKTLVIITADNGMFLGDHGIAGKWFPYEESIRVPLLVLDPRLPPEKRGKIDYDSFTLNVDLASTIMAAAKVNSYDSVQGRDFSELYRRSTRSNLKETPWRTEFLYDYPPAGGIARSSALVTHDYKYVEWPGPESTYTQLFDRRTDEYEQHDLLRGDNITQKYLDIAATLKARHDRYKAEIE